MHIISFEAPFLPSQAEMYLLAHQFVQGYFPGRDCLFVEILSSWLRNIIDYHSLSQNYCNTMNREVDFVYTKTLLGFVSLTMVKFLGNLRLPRGIDLSALS
jgi:hypothetical protein